MAASRFISLLLALVGVSFSAQVAHALHQSSDQKDADAAIEKFLASNKSDSEGAESQGSAVADLNGDGKPEIILVWTTMGPTYWHNTLTVFTKTSGGYKPVASSPLTGEAKSPSAKGGIIFVDQVVYAKKDPLCCPTIKKRAKYRWLGKKILEVKK